MQSSREDHQCSYNRDLGNNSGSRRKLILDEEILLSIFSWIKSVISQGKARFFILRPTENLDYHKTKASICVFVVSLIGALDS